MFCSVLSLQIAEIQLKQCIDKEVPVLSVCFWFLSFPQNGPSWSPFKHSSQKPIIQAFYYASLFHLVWHLLGEIFKVSLPSVIFKMKVIFANSTDWFECCVCFSSSVHLILMGLLGPYLVCQFSKHAKTGP